jgi:hypothetical protein
MNIGQYLASISKPDPLQEMLLKHQFERVLTEEEIKAVLEVAKDPNSKKEEQP